MGNRKLGKRTDQRLALVYGQAADLLWHGKIETTVERAGLAGRTLQPHCAHKQEISSMELAGLEPATSWVRSRRSPS